MLKNLQGQHRGSSCSSFLSDEQADDGGWATPEKEATLLWLSKPPTASSRDNHTNPRILVLTLKCWLVDLFLEHCICIGVLRPPWTTYDVLGGMPLSDEAGKNRDLRIVNPTIRGPCRRCRLP
jgi:hypothetical protein